MSRFAAYMAINEFLECLGKSQKVYGRRKSLKKVWLAEAFLIFLKLFLSRLNPKCSLVLITFNFKVVEEKC